MFLILTKVLSESILHPIAEKLNEKTVQMNRVQNVAVNYMIITNHFDVWNHVSQHYDITTYK